MIIKNNVPIIFITKNFKLFLQKLDEHLSNTNNSFTFRKLKLCRQTIFVFYFFSKN